MKIKPPQKVLVNTEVVVDVSLRWPPIWGYERFAEELNEFFDEHKEWDRVLSAWVHRTFEDRCPECGKPYELDETPEWAGHCAWNGCDLRELEATDLGPVLDEVN